jgi:hypothetical protein
MNTSQRQTHKASWADGYGRHWCDRCGGFVLSAEHYEVPA